MQIINIKISYFKNVFIVRWLIMAHPKFTRNGGAGKLCKTSKTGQTKLPFVQSYCLILQNVKMFIAYSTQYTQRIAPKPRVNARVCRGARASS